MYADGALSEGEAASLERHAATCAWCTARIKQLRRESTLLHTALRRVEDEAPIPPLRSRRARDLVVPIACVLLISGVIEAFWSNVAPGVPRDFGWWLFDVAVDVVTFIVFEGSAMWTAVRDFIGVALVLAFIAWLAFLVAGRTRRRSLM
jgi:anti-sigma factor RsiW